MTQEDKKLLLKDLSARLPYGVIINVQNNKRPKEIFDAYILSISKFLVAVNPAVEYIEDLGFEPQDFYSINEVRPYLRPMSSMTEEEADEFEKISNELLENGENTEIWDTVVDWLNACHFDHRDLIPMGLALEAPVDMYKTE